MRIEIKHNEGQYPSIDVLLYGESDEAFLTIKKVKIVNGSKGPFLGMPAQQDRKDPKKWWPHLYASQAFQDAVIKKAQGSSPPMPAPKKYVAPMRDESDDSIPF
jgi:DNA-binding cell septation regulator SpoVG